MSEIFTPDPAGGAPFGGARHNPRVDPEQTWARQAAMPVEPVRREPVLGQQWVAASRAAGAAPAGAVAPLVAYDPVQRGAAIRGVSPQSRVAQSMPSPGAAVAHPGAQATQPGAAVAQQAAAARVAAPGQAAPQAPATRATVAATGGRVGMGQRAEDGDVRLDELLRKTVAARGSDLHLTARARPSIRRDGKLQPLEDTEVLEGEALRRSIYQILTQRQRERFEEELELDLAYQVPGGSRFRVNVYQQRDNVGAAFRVIPTEIKPLEDLGVPAIVGSFANLPRGLVLVTGPTGSGKSTTLASVVDLANRTRAEHIMTVEDPIEFLHEHKKAIVNQREVGTDTTSFGQALKHVLRQDPDIILVGELRDLETISVALTAAETGHLVFATLHTQDAAQTIDRIIDVFPPEQQDQVRVQLAGAIQGVVCQTLCKRSDGPGRAVATEVLIATPAIRNLIREGKTHQIYSALQAGKSLGMHSMDQHLADLVRQGRISYETGLEKCHFIEDFNRLSGRAGNTGAGVAAASMGAQAVDEEAMAELNAQVYGGAPAPAAFQGAGPVGGGYSPQGASPTSFTPGGFAQGAAPVFDPGAYVPGQVGRTER